MVDMTGLPQSARENRALWDAAGPINIIVIIIIVIFIIFVIIIIIIIKAMKGWMAALLTCQACRGTSSSLQKVKGPNCQAVLLPCPTNQPGLDWPAGYCSAKYILGLGNKARYRAKERHQVGPSGFRKGRT